MIEALLNLMPLVGIALFVAGLYLAHLIWPDEDDDEPDCLRL